MQCSTAFHETSQKHRDLVKNKGNACDPGGKRSYFVLAVESFFDIGAPNAIHEIHTKKLIAVKVEEGGYQFLRGSEYREKGPYVW